MFNHIVSNLYPNTHVKLPAMRQIERRRALRVEMPFPATVRYTDGTGERWRLDVTIDNLSACGLYVRLPRPVALHDQLFLVVRLAPSADDRILAPRVALRGRIVRVEPHSDGQYGVALEFDQHRFLYATPPEC